jgi:hypothetical protein
MKPATPNEVDMVRRLAAFAFEAPAEADAVEEDALLVLEDPEAVGEAAAEPLLLPPSDTVEFKQEELLPAWTVTMSEYAVSPVLSFKLMVLWNMVSPNSVPTLGANELTSWCRSRGQCSRCTKCPIEWGTA